jgi:hypothetical protein
LEDDPKGSQDYSIVERRKMYKPLTGRVSRDTTEEKRIEHLIEFYKEFLSIEKAPDWTDLDSEVISTLINLKQRARSRNCGE